MVSSDQLPDGVGFPPSTLGFCKNNKERFVVAPSTNFTNNKDLVTFLEALSSVLDGRPWLNFSFANALDGAVLGSGATFTVRRHILQRRIHSPPHRLVPGQTVILKVAHGGFSKTQDENSQEKMTDLQMDALVREILILAHPPIRNCMNVVDLVQLMWEFEGPILRPVLVLEYAELGTLTEYLECNGDVSVQQKRSFCADVARGLSWLHQAGVIHGDVKCDNVLLFENADNLPVAKLTDFGFSILLGEVPSGSSIFVGGTPPFNAPETDEVIPRERLMQTDYYSFGMLVWQVLLNGEKELFNLPPFMAPGREESDATRTNYIKSSKKDRLFPKNVCSSVRAYAKNETDEDMEAILQNLLQSNPQERSFMAALQHLDPALASCFQEHIEGGHLQTKSVEALPNQDMLDLSRFSTAPYTVKATILKSLEKHAGDDYKENPPKAGQASFLVAQCYFNGFGIPAPDDNKGLQWLFKAARLECPAAQEVCINVCKGIGVEIENPETEGSAETGSWLATRVDSGSRVAAQTLLDLMNQDFDHWAEERDKIKRLEVIASVVTLELRPSKYGINPSMTTSECSAFLSHAVDAGLEKPMNEGGDTILHWAAAFGYEDIVEAILTVEPDLVDIQNDQQETALLVACYHGQTTIVELLIRHKARSNHVSLTGETALHWLVAFPDDSVEEVGKLLLDDTALKSYALANPATTGHFGDIFVAGTPLHRAIALRRRKVIEFLLKNGGDPFVAGEILFSKEKLAQAGFEAVDESLSGPSYLPFHWALQSHDVGTLLLLLKMKPFRLPLWPTYEELQAAACLAPNVPKKTTSNLLLPFGVTKLKNNTEFLKAFQERMAEQDDGLGCPLYASQSSLSYACNPSPRFFRLAILGGKQRLALKMTFQTLFNAMQQQSVERVSYMGHTAIMEAVENNDTEVVMHLLQRDDTKLTLEKSYKGGWGMKPLHVAALNNNFRVMNALLNAGADPRGVRSDGTTALQVCASQFFPDQEIAKILINKAPQLVSQKNIEETPFATAVRNQDFKLADLLLEKGADVNQLIGPHETNTILFQILQSSSESDKNALEYLLATPTINFIVAPQKQYTALHAAATLRARYDIFESMCAPATEHPLFKMLLEKWHRKDQLLARDVKGLTALHNAVAARDMNVVKLLVPAMKAAGADLNTLSDYFGSPVHWSALDLVPMRANIPEGVRKRGKTAIKLYEQLTRDLDTYLEAHGAKHSKEVVKEHWDHLSFVEKQKAKFLASEHLKQLVMLTELFEAWMSLGPDVKSTRERIETEKNPEEVRWKR